MVRINCAFLGDGSFKETRRLLLLFFFFRVIMVFIDDLKNSINIFVHSCIAIWLKLFPETSKIVIFFKYRIFR